MYSVNDYDYALPREQIAQEPRQARDQSRLLHLDRRSGTCSHHRFSDIKDMLVPGDLLVVNDTAVIPARLYGQKRSGGGVEILITNYPEIEAAAAEGTFSCECLIRASKAPKPGAFLDFGPGVTAMVKAYKNGRFIIEFQTHTPLDEILKDFGETPLPPYIHRTASAGDEISYQTVYAARKGAVAAPTAGLHFTQALLADLRNSGIEIVRITLHVGYGTFMPIRVEDIREHEMHEESFEIPESSATAINRAKKEGRRVIAVGTTSVRTLEYAAGQNERIRPQSGKCDLFIYPGHHRFQVVDAMITNFHLPRSTLLMLVSAFAGKDTVLDAYREAVEKGYRFYSYGDAMMIDDRHFASSAFPDAV